MESSIQPSDLELARNGQMLQIRVAQSAVQIDIVDYFNAGAGVWSIDFAGASVWTDAQIRSRVASTAANAMSGTAGNDVFVVDDAGDSITELPGQGTDTVLASIDYVLADQIDIENVTLAGNFNLRVIGNAGNNVLRGNAGDNTFNGDDELCRGGPVRHRSTVRGLPATTR